MATHLDYDTDERIIYVTTAPTGGTLTLDVKQNIYSDMKKDWKEIAALNKFKFPLSFPVGGNVIVPGEKYISPYYFLQYDWTMRPYEGDHTLYLENAYLLLDGGGDPWNNTLGGYTVNVRDSIPADAFTIVEAGGDPDTIAAAVWAYMVNSARTAGEELENITGVVDSIETKVDSLIAAVSSVDGKIDAQDVVLDALRIITGNDVTKAGDIITIYEDDKVTPWRKYNLANGQRIRTL
jgi:hypothetical protein